MKSTIRNSVFFIFFALMILSLFPKSPIQAQASQPTAPVHILPVCGTYDHPEDIYKIKDVPVWAFHGEQDKVVPFAPVNAMVNDLKAKGGNVKFTIYPDMGHDIGPITYANKELYQWLLEQRNDY